MNNPANKNDNGVSHTKITERAADKMIANAIASTSNEGGTSWIVTDNAIKLVAVYTEGDGDYWMVVSLA